MEITKELLERKYFVEGKSTVDIAKELGICKTTVGDWFKKDEIIRQKGGRNLIDLTGKTFGKLTVISKVVNHNNTSAKWLCQCECGNFKEVVRSSLMNGLTTSCGCRKFNALWKGFGKLSKSYWSRVKKGAKLRGLVFDITIEDAWNKYEEQNGKCALTGDEVLIVTDYTHKHILHTASLDRIDNNKGW